MRYAGNVPASRKDTNAWHMYGEPQKDGFLHLTCFSVQVKDALELAHKHRVTMTVFMSAVYDWEKIPGQDTLFHFGWMDTAVSVNVIR